MHFFGEMAEWSIALPWKGSERLSRSEGSTPSLSATKKAAEAAF